MLSHYNMLDAFDPWMEDPFYSAGRHHDFGRSFHPNDLGTARPLGMNLYNPNGYRRNWQLAHPQQRYVRGSMDPAAEQTKQLSCIMSDKGFQVCVDVHQFAPKEISVRTVGHSVVIEGKHEERPDEHGFIQRHFVRRYSLPETHDVDHVQTTLSSDGVLTVKAPLKKEALKSKEKEVQIQHTGPVHLSVKSTTDQGTTANGTANGGKA